MVCGCVYHDKHFTKYHIHVYTCTQVYDMVFGSRGVKSEQVFWYIAEG